MESTEQADTQQEMLDLARQIVNWDQMVGHYNRSSADKYYRWYDEERQQERRDVDRAIARLLHLMGNRTYHLPDVVQGGFTIKTALQEWYNGCGIMVKVSRIPTGEGWWAGNEGVDVRRTIYTTTGRAS